MKRKHQSKPQSRLTLILELILLGLGLWLFWRVQPPGTPPTGTSQSADRTLLYAAKSGTQVKIYQKDIKKGTQSEVFNYENGSDGNVHVALAQDKHSLAYVSSDGLQIYDLDSKKKQTLIKKQSAGKADRSESPSWSVAELNQGAGTSYLGDLAFSTDGKYICFVKGYTQSLNLGILEVANSHYIDLPKGAGFLAWSPAKTQLVLASSTGDNSGLLQVSAPRQLTELTDVKAKLTPVDRFFAEAQFNQSGKRLAASYRDADASNGLVTFNPDGTDLKTITKADRIFAPIYLKTGDLSFVQSVGSKASLMKQTAETANVSKLRDLPDGFGQWYNPVLGSSGLLSLTATIKTPDSDISSQFLVLSTSTGEVLYKSQPQEVFVEFK